MKKIIVPISVVLITLFVYIGITTRHEAKAIGSQLIQLQLNNSEMVRKIDFNKTLEKKPAIPLSLAYAQVLNQIKILESYSGTSISVRLEGQDNLPDLIKYYKDTIYKGIKGIKIQIIIKKFSQETDMAAVLDDVFLLEKDTDFLASAIIKDNNDLIVKGEIYGV